MKIPRLVAFDLDGTLAESKQRMSAEMGELITQLLKKMPVAVMSGAGWSQFEKQFFVALPPEAPLDKLYIFPDNAAQCFVHKDGAWHPQYDQAFTTHEKEHITSVLNAALEQVGLANAPVRVWGEQIEDRGAEIAFSPLGQSAPLEAKEEWHSAHDDIRKNLHAVLSKTLPEFANSMGGLTTIDITRKGITKAYGIRRLSEITGIDIREMLYIGDALGDGGNDEVVTETGISTHTVFGPEETASVIQTIVERP